MTIPLDIDAIEKRCEAATAGPWEYSSRPLIAEIASRLFTVCHWPKSHSAPPRKEDATFIAHARKDVPALIAEVRRLEEAVTRLMEDILESEAQAGGNL